jgi:hypothetical protein
MEHKMKKLIILFLFTGLLASCSTSSPSTGDNSKANPAVSSSPTPAASASPTAPVSTGNPATPSSPTAPQNIKEGFRISYDGKDYELQKNSPDVELSSFIGSNQIELLGKSDPGVRLIITMASTTGPNAVIPKGFKSEDVGTAIMLSDANGNYKNQDPKQTFVFMNTTDKIIGYFEGYLYSETFKKIGPVKIQFNLPYPVKK